MNLKKAVRGVFNFVAFWCIWKFLWFNLMLGGIIFLWGLQYYLGVFSGMPNWIVLYLVIITIIGAMCLSLAVASWASEFLFGEVK